MSSLTFEDLDALSTEDLQDRAFALARERRDVSFFWSIFGHLPAAKQKFFDASASVAQFDAPPASEPQQPLYPCVGCPSTGATNIVPSSQVS